MAETTPTRDVGNSSGCAVAAGIVLAVIVLLIAILLAWPYLTHAPHRAPIHNAPPADTLLPPPEHSDLGPASER